jgi:hypothetical protein
MTRWKWALDHVPAWALVLMLVAAVLGVVLIVNRVTSSSYTMRAKWGTGGSLELLPTPTPVTALTCSRASP